MKKKVLGTLALSVLALVSCNKDPMADTGLTGQEKALKAAVESYVPNVIYKIYGNLADETETLYNQLSALKEKDTYAQADIDKICATFLSARKWWEQSEAFLYGAATAYGIDPRFLAAGQGQAREEPFQCRNHCRPGGRRRRCRG